MGVLALYPTLYALYTSLQRFYLADPTRRRWVGLDNYIALGQDDRFWNSVVVTVEYLVTAVAIEVVLGFAIALLLHTPRRFTVVLRTIMLVPMILAPIVVGSMWKFMYNNQFGIITYLAGQLGFHSLFLSDPASALWSIVAADIWQWTPFVTLICLAGLATLPVEAFKAAAVDGASSWRMFWHITLPLTRPFLAIATVLRFITAYKVFDSIYIMTSGGPGGSTTVLSMLLYETAFTNLQIGDASALGVLIVIVATLATKVFTQRFLFAPGGAETLRA